MSRPTDRPAPPRVSPPDLPRELGDDGQLLPRSEGFQQRFSHLSGTVDGAYSRLDECVVASASVDRLDLTGATLVDVDVLEPRAVELVAKSGRWRNVRIAGGRIGTLDLSLAELDSVELRGMRIEYLLLGQCTATDLLIADCAIGSLDVPLSTLTRVAFTDSRADDVDTRGLRAEHVDLRGLDALAITDATALRGTTLSLRQLEALAGTLGAALGIHVRD